jgi:hypothetical protein
MLQLHDLMSVLADPLKTCDGPRNDKMLINRDRFSVRKDTLVLNCDIN